MACSENQQAFIFNGKLFTIIPLVGSECKDSAATRD